jgi:hypothetical protein
MGHMGMNFEYGSKEGQPSHVGMSPGISKEIITLNPSDRVVSPFTIVAIALGGAVVLGGCVTGLVIGIVKYLP